MIRFFFKQFLESCKRSHLFCSLCNFLEQVSEEVERALSKLGQAKLAGRCFPTAIYRNFLVFWIMDLPL